MRNYQKLLLIFTVLTPSVLSAEPSESDCNSTATICSPPHDDITYNYYTSTSSGGLYSDADCTVPFSLPPCPGGGGGSAPEVPVSSLPPLFILLAGAATFLKKNKIRK